MLGIHQGDGASVLIKTRKRDRKIVDIKYKIFFVSDDRMQKLFDQKELQIKISVMQFTFNELCFVTIHEKPWAVAREVCRALEYGKATKNADIVKRLCSRNNYAHKWQLTELFLKRTSWIGQGIREKMTITSMGKGCTSWYFQVNSQKQKTSESIVVM